MLHKNHGIKSSKESYQVYYHLHYSGEENKALVKITVQEVGSNPNLIMLWCNFLIWKIGEAIH